MSESERQAGAEVEVNEEMLKAGVSAFCEHDLRFERLDDVLRHVFEAMLASQRPMDLTEAAASTPRA